MYIPEQFTVKAHPGLFKGEGRGRRGWTKKWGTVDKHFQNVHKTFQSIVDIHFRNVHKTQKNCEGLHSVRL